MEWAIIGKIFLAFFLGLVIGIERTIHNSPAGVRTYAAIALGACLFGVLSTHVEGPTIYQSVVDPSRIAAQIVSGIGFIGAGVIFKSGDATHGLTTAATIWVTAAIGLSIAFGQYSAGIVTTFIVIFLLALNYMSFWIKFKSRYVHRRQ